MQPDEQAVHARRQAERRSIARGLLWIGMLLLLFAIARAGLGRAFVPGWWREW